MKKASEYYTQNYEPEDLDAQKPRASPASTVGPDSRPPPSTGPNPAPANSVTEHTTDNKETKKEEVIVISLDDKEEQKSKPELSGNAVPAPEPQLISNSVPAPAADTQTHYCSSSGSNTSASDGARGGYRRGRGRGRGRDFGEYNRGGRGGYRGGYGSDRWSEENRMESQACRQFPKLERWDIVGYLRTTVKELDDAYKETVLMNFCYCKETVKKFTIGEVTAIGSHHDLHWGRRRAAGVWPVRVRPAREVPADIQGGGMSRELQKADGVLLLPRFLRGPPQASLLLLRFAPAV